MKPPPQIKLCSILQKFPFVTGCSKWHFTFKVKCISGWIQYDVGTCNRENSPWCRWCSGLIHHRGGMQNDRFVASHHHLRHASTFLLCIHRLYPLFLIGFREELVSSLSSVVIRREAGYILDRSPVQGNTEIHSHVYTPIVEGNLKTN